MLRDSLKYYIFIVDNIEPLSFEGGFIQHFNIKKTACATIAYAFPFSLLYLENLVITHH